MKNPRVGIIGLQHESNTFLAGQTTLADFDRDLLVTGEAVRREYGAAHHEIGGFFEGLDEAGIEAVPIFASWAMPSGLITAEAEAGLIQRMFDALDQAGPLDGLLIAPHGAAVGAKHRDFDGHWLEELRQRVGREMPIVCTLDLHANVSPRMISSCDATISYRTNPHLDQRARGLEAARLMVRTLSGEIRPTQAAAFPRIAINIERQLTTISPCRELYAMADQQLAAHPEVMSNSVVLGFPYADVAEMGSSVIVVTNNNPGLAQKLADDMARYLMEHRRDFLPNLIDIPAAIDRALASPAPVCLLDMGDNAGGGSPADGTLLAKAILDRKAGPAFVCLYDPAVAEQLRFSRPGGFANIRVGGKTDALHGEPLNLSVRTISRHDGAFTESSPRHGGKTSFDMGPTAVVETLDGLMLMITTRRIAPFSLAQLTSCGIDPTRFRVIVAKGVNAPIAAYEPVCPTFIRVNTPGVTTADVTTLPFANRRRPMFPFEDVSE